MAINKLPLNPNAVGLDQTRNKVNEILDGEAAGTFGGSDTTTVIEYANTTNYGTGSAPDNSKFVDTANYFSQTSVVSGGGTICGADFARGPNWVTLNGEMRVAGYNNHCLGSNDPGTQSHAQEARPLQLHWNDYAIEYNGGYLSKGGVRELGVTGQRLSCIQTVNNSTGPSLSFLTEGGELWNNQTTHNDPDTTWKPSFRGNYRIAKHVMAYSATRAWDGHDNGYHGCTAIWNGSSEAGPVDMNRDSIGYKALQPGTIATIGSNHFGQMGVTDNYGAWELEWKFPVLTTPSAGAGGPIRGIAYAGDMGGLTNQEGNVILVKNVGSQNIALCENGTVWGCGNNSGGLLSPGIGQGGDTSYANAYDGSFPDQPAVNYYVKKFLCIYGWVPGTIAAWGKAINVWTMGGYKDGDRQAIYILTDKGNLLGAGGKRFLGYKMDDGYHNNLNTDSGAYKRNFDIICGPNANSNSYGFSSDLSLSVKRFWHNEGYYSQMFVEFNDPDQRGSTLYSFGYNGHGQLGHNNVINPHGYSHTQTAPKAVGSLMRGTWKAGTFNNPIHGADPSVDYAQSANMAGPDNWIKIREVILAPTPNSGGQGHITCSCIITEDGRIFLCGYQHSNSDSNRRRSLVGASYYLEGNPAQGIASHTNYLNYTVTNNQSSEWSYRWKEVDTSAWIGKVIRGGTCWWGSYSSYHFLTDKGAVYQIGREYYGSSASLCEDWSTYWQSPIRGFTLGQS